MAKLINGNGNPAIYAAEDADLIASLAGNVTCIANVGNKYAATEEDATTIRLDDGVIITKEGRRIQLEAGESDTFYIPTGTSGVTNYYIIGYKLVQNADSTQVAEQFVQKMNSSSETITEDTFRGGATEVYVSLYRVTQVGFTISSITGLLPELLDSNSAKDDIAQINSALTPVSFREEIKVDGKYSVTRLGNLVIVTFSTFTIDLTDHPGGLITSGMPAPTKDIYALAFSTESPSSNEYRIKVDTSGNLYVVEKSAAYISNNIPYVTGQLIYTA